MDLNKLYRQYNSLVEKHGFDFKKFNAFTIVHHSTAIENSTLSMTEVYNLLNDDLTPNSKPRWQMNMTIDHYEALQYVMNLAENKLPLTIEEIQKIAGLVLTNTGQILNHPLGQTDSTKGDFRKVGVRVDNRSFMDYQKVPEQVEKLSAGIRNNIDKINSIDEVYDLAFLVHYQLVTIHPFLDGNGRTSRLLMNYIQHYHSLPMTIVFAEDKVKYFEALEQAREKNDIRFFTDFMFQQANKYFETEIKNLTKDIKESTKTTRGFNLLF